MGITFDFSTPFYTGAGTSLLVPNVYPVALAGRNYLIDLESGQFRRQSIPMLRTQADASNLPNESSLNPEELWRRGQEMWHKGAGQVFLDRPESDSARFRSSKGINPWERWQVSLLPETDQKRTSANTNLQLAVAGANLYLIDGAAVVTTADITPGTPTFTALTGSPGGAWKSITSDGDLVYATDGNDIYRWSSGATAVGAAWNTQDVDLLVWVRGKGRLMAALNTGATRSVFNVTSAAAPTDIAPTTIGATFTWVGFAEGANVIYGAGYKGDKSAVFRWGIKSDGTGLDAAIPALIDGLPDGEIIRSIYSYAGFVKLGTDLGIRYCQPDTAGNLRVGPIIRTANPVRCFEGQDRFVWFGMTNYDASSTGLGRLDPSIDTGDSDVPVPAWASDLMAGDTATPVQGNVLSIATFQNRRVFAVSGQGVWAEEATLVASGSFDSGLFAYGIGDPKVAMFADIRHTALAGTITTAVSVDGGPFNTVDSSATDGSVNPAPFAVGEKVGHTFELRQTLTRHATATMTGPTLTRHTLRSYPGPNRGQVFTVPLILYEQIDIENQTVPLDVLAEFQFLENVWSARLPVTFQLGDESHSVLLDDFDWQPRRQTSDRAWWDHTFVVRLKKVGV